MAIARVVGIALAAVAAILIVAGCPQPPPAPSSEPSPEQMAPMWRAAEVQVIPLFAGGLMPAACHTTPEWAVGPRPTAQTR